MMDRKTFIRSAAFLAGASAVLPAFAKTSLLHDKTKQGVVLKKGLGYGMIKEDLSLTDKFKLVKDLGFDGIELNSPVEYPLPELLEAKEKSGIVIPSVVNKDHWSKPLSHPDPQIREECIRSVAQSLRDVKDLGGDTVLVVPGVVNETMPYEQAYKTSLESVRKLIPYAEKTGMQIGLENVWNNFILSPVEAARFVDEINHPLVGWYFDIGNVLRYGWPEHWIAALNSRIRKLHIKEFSRELMNKEGLWAGFKVGLLEGDNNWPVVMKALSDINYQGGWLTAEVGGGDREYLKDLSARMDKIIAYL
jgi:hexulose-6-phosphate isomerase